MVSPQSGRSKRHGPDRPHPQRRAAGPPTEGPMSHEEFFDRQEPDPDPLPDDVEITEFGGIRVAYVPGEGESWISGWVDVPR